mgnify:FL=1
MVKYDFDTPYELVSSQVSVCEDTARCLVSFPNWKNKDEIIDFINKNNFITSGVYSTDKELLEHMNYYLGGDMLQTIENYNLLERQFT